MIFFEQFPKEAVRSPCVCRGRGLLWRHVSLGRRFRGAARNATQLGAPFPLGGRSLASSGHPASRHKGDTCVGGGYGCVRARSTSSLYPVFLRSWRPAPRGGPLSLSLPSAPYLCPFRARGSGSVCWRPFGLAQRSSPHGLKVETRIARTRFGFVVACEICAAYLELSSTSSDCSSAAVAGCSPTAPGRMLGSAVALPAV